MTDLEIHRLDLRYEGLRVRSPERDRRLVASLAEVGQAVPIVVVDGEGATADPVVIDGYRRIRALSRLGREVVLSIRWELAEMDAILLRRSLSSTGGETSLEQAWLLEELRCRFGLSLEELARRFDRTVSWVSRRLALLRELPRTVQDFIRDGRIVPHAAAKHLVPLARANKAHCERLARAIAPHRLSSREVGEIYAAWRDAPPAAREHIVEEPDLFLRTRRAMAEEADRARGPRTRLVEDLVAIQAIARRGCRRVRDGAVGRLAPAERDEVGAALDAAGAGMQLLAGEITKAIGAGNARPGNADGDLRTPEEGHADPADLGGPLHLPGGGAPGAFVRDADGPPAREEREGEAVP
jgi:ParB-like chromosome segregation protein Spo0J